MADKRPDTPDAGRAARLATLAIHSALPANMLQGTMTVPLIESTAFTFESSEQASRLFEFEADGYVYTRVANPTVAALETRISNLEGGIGAVCTSCGQSAFVASFLALVEAGDSIAASQWLYANSTNVLDTWCRRFGVEPVFFDPRDRASIERAIRPTTKAMIVESVSNPSLAVCDIPELAAIARAHGVPLIVDNSLPSFVLCRPVDHGADIVVSSLSKYVAGHGGTLGGVVVDLGRFDWATASRFRSISDATPPHLSYADRFGKNAYLMRVRTDALRDLGMFLCPTAAYSLLRGIETIVPRMQYLMQTTRRLIDWLHQDPRVLWVRYPSLPDHPDCEVARRIIPDGAGPLFPFGVNGGYAAAVRFMDALRLIQHAAMFGTPRTIAMHPASTSHKDLSREALVRAGLTPELIRLSVGLEDVDDLIADLDRALEAAAHA